MAATVPIPPQPPVAQAPVVVDEATLSARRWALAWFDPFFLVTPGGRSITGHWVFETQHFSITSQYLCTYIIYHYIILYYIVLYYIILYYVELCYIILCYVILSYLILYYVILDYIKLCYIILCYVVLCYIILYYIILCYVMLCYSILCCVILYYIMLYYIILYLNTLAIIYNHIMCIHMYICQVLNTMQ